MTRIQILTIVINFLFLIYIAKLIVKGRLREEYAIVWLIGTLAMLVFSFWSEGLDVISKMFGIHVPSNFVFAGFIFMMLIYLLHLSVVNSKLHGNVTRITQELAIMKEKMEKRNNEPEEHEK